MSSEWNTEQVRKDASGDSEDGEDDELPCVIGESAGDCVWHTYYSLLVKFNMLLTTYEAMWFTILVDSVCLSVRR